jgi:hypothetical protein
VFLVHDLRWLAIKILRDSVIGSTRFQMIYFSRSIGREEVYSFLHAIFRLLVLLFCTANSRDTGDVSGFWGWFPTVLYSSFWRKHGVENKITS